MSRNRKLPPGMWKRGSVYYARFHKNGRLVRKRLSTSFDSACEILNDLRARADRSDFGLVDNDYRWEDLRREFLRWAAQAVRRPKQYERHLDQFERFMRVSSIRQVDHAYVVQYREWRLSQPIANPTHKNSKRAPKYPSVLTVNMEVATLRAMLNRGGDWKRIGTNPIAGLRPLAETSPRKQRRSLTIEEVGALFKASPDWLVRPLQFFAATGVRREELTELRFSDIDLAQGVATIRADIAKSGHSREIPLRPETLSMLKDLKDAAPYRQPARDLRSVAKLSQSHVFVTKANTPLRNNLLRAFYAACRRAKIEGGEPGGEIDLHSLRVTFTTLALEHGASPKAVQAILGHSTMAMTMGGTSKQPSVPKKKR